MVEKCWWEYDKRRFFLRRDMKEEGRFENFCVDNETGRNNFAKSFLRTDYQKAEKSEQSLEDGGICERYTVTYESMWGKATVTVRQRYDAQAELQEVEVVVRTNEKEGKCDVMARVPPRCEKFGLQEAPLEESILNGK